MQMQPTRRKLQNKTTLKQVKHNEHDLSYFLRFVTGSFGNVRREKDGGGLRRVEEMEVLGGMPAGRPKRTWRETVKSDMEKLGISEELAMDRAGRRRVISKYNPL